MSKVKALYHVVFCTKRREMTIPNQFRGDLYAVILHTFSKHHCHVNRIEGVPDHIHILFDLHPSVSLADVIRQVKAETSGFLSRDHRFPLFEGWGSGYFAMTVSPADIHHVIEYIDSQQAHHAVCPFFAELIDLHRSAGLTLHDDDMI